jgi:hypothetical protein
MRGADDQKYESQRRPAVTLELDLAPYMCIRPAKSSVVSDAALAKNAAVLGLVYSLDLNVDPPPLAACLQAPDLVCVVRLDSAGTVDQSQREYGVWSRPFLSPCRDRSCSRHHESIL